MKTCGCGCGREVTSNRKGVRYCKGHGRWAGHVVALPYHEEDRGYETPCWIYEGYTHPKKKYGYVHNSTAHRLSYEREVGPVPEGLDLDHKCRVRPCIRPDHLEPVTRKVNCERSPIMGRPKKEVA